jgi:hypothetical protein
VDGPIHGSIHSIILLWSFKSYFIVNFSFVTASINWIITSFSSVTPSVPFCSLCRLYHFPCVHASFHPQVLLVIDLSCIYWVHFSGLSQIVIPPVYQTVAFVDLNFWSWRYRSLQKSHMPSYCQSCQCASNKCGHLPSSAYNQRPKCTTRPKGTTLKSSNSDSHSYICSSVTNRSKLE